MFHLTFFILHIAAVLFSFFGLFITIPLHIIASMIRERNQRELRRTGQGAERRNK